MYYLESVQRRNRLILVGSLVVLLLVLLWVARGALLPYIIASVLIYLLLPPVNLLDAKLQQLTSRPRFSRALAIVLIYIICLCLLAIFVALIVPVLNQQFKALWIRRFSMSDRIVALFQQGLGWYREHVPVDIQIQIDTSVRQIGDTVTAALQVGATRTFTFITGTVGFIIGFVVVPFWMFYVMYDQKRIKAALKNLVPERFRPDAGNLWCLVDSVLGAYVRGQLLLCFTIGLLSTVGLTLLHVPFPAVLGLVAGLFEALPFVGPILGAIPAVLVAFVQSPLLALWVILLFLGIQQLENLLLVPRVSGRAVQLHPAVIMLVLVVGNEVAGLLGMLVAVPITAIIRDIFRYLYLRLQDEPCLPEEAMTRMGRA